MKILHVVPSVSPIRGGSTVAVLEIVRSLLHHGIQTEIVTTNDDGAGVLDLPLGQQIEVEGIPVTCFPRWSPPISALSEFAVSRSHTRWLRQHLPEYDLLVIHSLFSYVCTASGQVARQQGRPYVICPHGHFAPWVIQQKRTKKMVYHRLFEAANLQQATAIHCTTAAEAQNVRNFGIVAPTFTVPLGVTLPAPVPDARDRLRQQYHIPADRPIILFLSRFHPKKRPDFLLSVLAQLPDTLSFHLLLAGDGDPAYRHYLETHIQQLGLGDRVTLPGFLQGEAKAIALYGSDLFALPSYGENFGLAVAEAMAAGLPVVITPAVEIAEDIAPAQAGWVVPDVEADWVDSLTTAIAQPEVRQQMGLRGQTFAQTRYNWTEIGRHLADQYEQILSRDR